MDVNNNDSTGNEEDMDYLVADLDGLSFKDGYLADIPFEIVITESKLTYRIPGYKPLELHWDPTAINRFELNNLNVADPSTSFVELKDFQNRERFELVLAEMIQQYPIDKRASSSSTAVLVPYKGRFRRALLLEDQEGAETVKVFLVDDGIVHDARFKTLTDITDHPLANIKPQMMPVCLPGQGLHKPAGFDEDLKCIDCAYLELTQLVNYGTVLIEAKIKLYKDGHEANLLTFMIEEV